MPNHHPEGQPIPDDNLSQAIRTRYAVPLAEAALSYREAYDLDDDEAIRQAIAACDGVQDTWTLRTAIKDMMGTVAREV